MALPTPDQFTSTMREHALEHVSPEQLKELMPHLLSAFETLAPFQPMSVRPVPPPWRSTALAFEASWPDAYSLTVATRLPPFQGSPTQITLSRAGQMVYALGSTYDHLAASVELCMSHRPVVLVPRN
ncbi:hypothetical protein [Hymenobacter koreensis]|uniref:Uncharacterized protein n=1 Tax=Hymenobacter koreensis TaxID=1084523 RepID=A0ABP8J7P4_9BACT